MDVAGNAGVISNKALLGTLNADALRDTGAGTVFSGNGANDTLTGSGHGDNVFVFHASFGRNTITNFTPGTSAGSAHDVLAFDHSIVALSGLQSDADLASYVLSHTTYNKQGAIISVGGDTIMLAKVTKLSADDFHFV